MNRRLLIRVSLSALAAALALTAAWRTVHLVRVLNAGKLDGRPVAMLEFTELSLGNMAAGSVVQARFPIHNAGNRRLLLWETSAGCCGQAAAAQQPRVLQPGEANELIVEVDTSRWDGQVRQQVRYSTNDRELPRFTLTVEGVVKQ